MRTGMVVAAVLVLAWAATAGATVWNVSTVAALNNAVNSCASGDEIVIAAGTYMLTQSLNMDVADVILRGATGNPDNVILQGAGMNVNAMQEGIWVAADDITIMDLTVKEFYYNGIHIRGENDADRMWVYNVKTHDIGERHIKGSTNNNDANLIANDCLIEFVQMSQDQPKTAGSVNYIGSIDAMGIAGWVIHDCTATNVIGGTGGGNAGVFLWNYANNCTVERNKIVGCGKGIALGNPMAPGHAGANGYHCQGGIVRNNMVKRANGFDNIGFEICYTKDVKFYYNSGWSDDANYFRMIHVYNAVTTNLQSKYNVVRGKLFLNGATWTDVGSIIGSAPVSTWFTDSSTGNLHLTANATTCIDQAVKNADIIEDFDKNLRGNSPDKGADEYNPPASTIVSFDAGSSNAYESTSAVNMGVSLAFPSNVVVSVNYAVTGGTATSGTDYTFSSGTLTFQPGETAKTISFTVTGDSTGEDNETVIVGLSSPSNCTLGAYSSHTYTINDDDPWGNTTGRWAHYRPQNLATVINPNGRTYHEVASYYHPTNSNAQGGAFLTKSQFEGLANRKVVTYNNLATAAGAPFTGATGLLYTRAEFALGQRFDFAKDAYYGAANGYNFGGYTSGGRSATSGANLYDMVGLSALDAYAEADRRWVCGAWTITPVNTSSYITALGFMFFTRTGAAEERLKAPKLIAKLEDLGGGNAIDATLEYYNASYVYQGYSYIGRDNVGYAFFGYQAPANKKITALRIDRAHTDQDNYKTPGLDDLGFQITTP